MENRVIILNGKQSETKADTCLDVPSIIFLPEKEPVNGSSRWIRHTYLPICEIFQI